MATAWEIQDKSLQYADQSVTAANGFIDTLSTIANGVSVPPVDQPNSAWQLMDRIQAEIAAIQNLKPVAPITSEIPIRDYTAPLVAITTAIKDIPIPSFNVQEPTIGIDLIVKPSTVLPSEPGSAPVLAAPTMPEKPVLGVLPDVPTLSAYNIPTPPTLNIPAFDSTLPVDDLVAPSNTFNFTEDSYKSALLDATTSKLLDDLINGSYGIDPSDEDRLWSRGVDRSLKAANIKLGEISRLGAARGFPIPPGFLIKAQQEALDAAHSVMNALNREIALKRSENYVQARQFTITSATALETILINYHSALMERALNVQKSILEAGIAIFNASVARYNTRLETYKTQALVWKTRIEGELARLEAYKGELEGIRIITETDKLRMEAYREQVKAVTILIELYKTELEAANIDAQIKQLTMAGYKTEVEAYAERVRAKVAEFSMYEAQIKGELAKVSLYESQVKAYTASVEGSKAAISAEAEKINAEIATKKLELEGFLGQLSAYKEYVNAVSAKITAALTAYGHEVDAFGRQTQGILSAYDSGAKSEIASLNAAVDTERIKIEASKADVSAFVEQVKLRVEAAAAGADVYKGLILGAMSAVNGLSGILETTNKAA